MSYSPDEIRRWRKVQGMVEMWEHYCSVEKTEMGVGKNEPCNWCGLTEEAYNSLHGETKIILNEEHEGINDHPKMPHFREG